MNALSAPAWKQSGKNTLPVPWAPLFTDLISSQRYGITPLDPWKSTLHWSEKLAMSHYAQTPNALAFSVLPNNHLPLCLFAINDWISVPQKSHFCFVYVSPIHTAATSTHGSMHSKAYLQPLDGGLWKQSWLFPSFSKAPLCALGLEAFCGGCTCTFTGCRRERPREGVLLLNNPLPSFSHHSVLSPPTPSSLTPSPCPTH